ncbi:PhoPQ-activated pathogenicity-related protein [Posidoniimonas polymericola]|uniref:PhoPQ-activated pathogenicity-related protein n=1 Tax=Posidoniimonas polymericola TaxID=2528002 RepID=A0A5C5ZG33_9BACT|nr:PhoPQ-activated pathogenicity-related family protein [Posidoniimonas polymericola]TWT85831.1 PhoPQ-activated pathogenicity-related protein [Posidoniimonas polymericola]
MTLLTTPGATAPRKRSRAGWAIACTAAGLLLGGPASRPASAEPALADPPSAKTDAPTALDRYVAEEDPDYGWRLVGRHEHPLGVEIVAELTSQAWRAADEVDRPVWKHSLVIVVPEGADPTTAMLFIGGGRNGADPPGGANDQVRAAALTTHSVVAELGMVPNQPLEIGADGQGRYEDDLLARSWNKYLETRDPTWVAQLPMAKSAVRAMDAVQEILKQEQPELAIERFTVAGASKRGWTTWLTAAVDPRVVAIAPIVIDVLNVDESMRHHHAAYGEWSPALRDYESQGLAKLFLGDQGEPILKLVDPYEYRQRYTMPKCLINATGDEFFLPDSSRFYFDQLPGEKHLCYVPNAGHSLKGSNALDTLIAFHHSVVHQVERPSITWRPGNGGQMTLVCSTEPTRVTLFQADNPAARDFRKPVIGDAFKPERLAVGADLQATADITTPAEGWRASFVQAEFDIGAATPWRVTTPVWVTPDVLPHAEGKLPPPPVGEG